MFFESEHLKLTFRNSDGCLLGIKNKVTGREYLKKPTSWISFVFDEGTSDIWECRPDAESARTISVVGQPARIRRSRGSLIITHNVADGACNVILEERISFTEDGSKVTSKLSIKNISEKGVVINVRYPDISGVKGGNDSLLWPIQDGSIFNKAFLTPEQGSDFTDENQVMFRSAIGDHDTYTRDVVVTNYPVPFCAQCCAVFNENEYLYMAHHDKDHSYKQFGFEKVGKLFIRHWPFVAPEKTVKLEPVCFGVGEGDWHKAADVYKAAKAEWPRDPFFARTEAGKNVSGMAIYQCVSFPEYYHLKYCDEAPAKTLLARADMSCRCLNCDGIGSPDFDTFGKAAIRARDEAGSNLVLFIGWHVGGLDAWYPDYEPVKALGGKEGLRKAIEEVHAAGMKAIFYVNVHIADRDSKWFNKPGYNSDRIGIDCAIKKANGDVWIERYPGTSRQTFVAQCPNAQSWTNAAIRAMRTVMELGADGIYFDELMTMPSYLCWDKSHGHRTPATAFNEGYKKFFTQVYKMIKKYRPNDFICGCEGVGDPYEQYIDIMCMHWWRKWGDTRCEYARPEILRYMMGRPLLGMQANGECGDNMAGYAFSMFAPLLEHPYVYPTAKRYHALFDKYPEIYRDGQFFDTVGITGLSSDTVRYGVMRSSDKKSAIIHLYNRAFHKIEAPFTFDGTKIGLPAGLKAYDAETGKAITLPISLEAKEKKAILFK